MSSVCMRGILNVGSKSALPASPWKFLGEGLIGVLCKFSFRLSSISMEKDVTLYHCYVIWMFLRYWVECRRRWLKSCTRNGERSELPLSLRQGLSESIEEWVRWRTLSKIGGDWCIPLTGRVAYKLKKLACDAENWE